MLSKAKNYIVKKLYVLLLNNGKLSQLLDLPLFLQLSGIFALAELKRMQRW